MNIREFIEAQLPKETEAAEACPPWPWKPNVEHDEVLSRHGETICEGFAFSGRQLRAVVDHVVHHEPGRALRQVDAARSILDRHTPWGWGPWPMACNGCPSGEMDPYVEHVDECPELQALAWWWADQPDWDPKWCPHYEYDTVTVPAPDDPRIKLRDVCRHCGQDAGHGWWWAPYKPKPGDSIVPEGAHWCPRCGDQNFEDDTRLCITCTPGHPQHDPRDRCYLLLKARQPDLSSNQTTGGTS